MKKYLICTFFILAFIFALKFFFSNSFSGSTSGYTGLLKNDSIKYLFIGSSQTRQSLNPHILEDSLGKSYILAYSGASFFYIDFLLDLILTKDKNVNTVVIEAYPYRAFQKTELSDPRLFRDLDYASKLKFFKVSNRFLTYWDKYDLLMLNGNESIATFPFVKKFMNNLSYMGGYEGKVVPGVSEVVFSKFRPPFPDTTKFTGLNKIEISALQSILDKAKIYPIKLIFFEPPVPNLISTSSIFKQSHTILKKLIQEKGYEYLDNSNYKFDTADPSLFNDPVHLSSSGRDKFSKSLSSVVKQDS